LSKVAVVKSVLSLLLTAKPTKTFGAHGNGLAGADLTPIHAIGRSKAV